MEKLIFEKTINAQPSVVFNKMLGKDTYKEWTAVFNPSSEFEGSWDEGSKISFVGLGTDQKRHGIIGVIIANRPNEHVAVKYTGLIEEDSEIFEGEKVDPWLGAVEAYTFENVNGATKLKIELDSIEEWSGYMKEAWPKALDKLKEICED